jgi:hypothetical protein
MDSARSGARIMVKLILTSLLVLSLKANAEFYVGMQNNSWQDVIPVTYTNNGTPTTFYALTTFSTLSFGGGYENSFATRWRYNADLYIHTGTADIHKIQGTVSPRKSVLSQWVSAKVSYRISKTFSMGPQMVVNTIEVRGAGSSTSLGALINSEIEMHENYRLVQTFGSMNDSGTIAYTIGIQRYF